MTQPPTNYQRMPQPQAGGGLATAAFVLGIVALCVSIVLFCVPPLGGLLGVLAIVLGAISMSQSPGAGKGRTGLILGVIAVLLSAGIFIAARAGLSYFGHKVQQSSQSWQQQLEDAAKKAQDQAQKAQQQAQQQQEQYQRDHPGATTQPATP
jgi:formate hydrogenlyase subunit 3/multisubunit Na+/H+ antiporter MnhD subunit